jgi:hypothetical protein
MLRPALLSSSLLLATAAIAQDGLPPVAPAPTPAGYTIDESGCASGGPQYHFFSGGHVVVDDCGDDCPFISEGTWTMSGEQGLTVKLTKAYVGKGDTPVQAASRTIYQNYTAEVRTIDKVETMLWDGGDGCVAVKKHDLPVASARALLRGGFKGDFPFLLERAVTDADLAGKSKEELGRMRNEIFAAYGHSFKNEALRKHFLGKPGYSPRFVDVTAFLSPMEKANVERIKAAEAKLK